MQLPLDLIGYDIYMHVVPEWIKWYSEHLNLQAVKGHISMRVVLEWIKWYSECFNLQDANEMTAINGPRLARCIGGRGVSATTTDSSEPMTQVSPIWMNIQ